MLRGLIQDFLCRLNLLYKINQLLKIKAKLNNVLRLGHFDRVWYVNNKNSEMNFRFDENYHGNNTCTRPEFNP